MNNNLLEFVRIAHRLVKRQLQPYSCKYSKKVFTQPQLVVINFLRIREGWTYQQTREFLEVADTLQRELELRRVPRESTLAKAYDRINCWMVRWVLEETSRQIDSSGKMAVDATGFQRQQASSYYSKRMDIELSSLKVTIRADVGDILAVRDVHMTTGRTHDTQILPKLIPTDEPGSFLAADKGYDHYDLHDWCRREGIRPLIKHSEHKPYDKAANARMDDDDYNQRQKVESIFSSVKQRYGDTLTSRVWYREYRDVLARMTIFNIDQLVKNKDLFFGRMNELIELRMAA